MKIYEYRTVKHFLGDRELNEYGRRGWKLLNNFFHAYPGGIMYEYAFEREVIEKNTFITNLESLPEHARFGAKRKHDIHTGVDFYCEEGTTVYALNEGKVIAIVDFTGEKTNSPWWNNTKAVLLKSISGIILYGEISTHLKLDDRIEKGDPIGKVKRVLKKYKGLPMSMLHLEMYDYEYKGSGEIWKLGEEKPESLLNIEDILKKYIDEKA